MKNFLQGFLKSAQEADNQSSKSWLPSAGTLGAIGTGLGAAATTYGLLRGKKPKTNLTKVVVDYKPKTRFGNAFHKLIYGTDDIVHTRAGYTIPSKAKKVKGTVIFEDPEDKVLLRGDRNIGALTPKQLKIYDDKLLESKTINKYAPGLHTPTRSAKIKGSGKKNLSALHREADARPYFLKPRTGLNSGVGGASFIKSDDVTDFLAGKKLPAKKMKVLNQILKKPGNFIMQRDMQIDKSPITRASREFRVHAIEGKVVPRTTSVRSRNIEDFRHLRNAEETFQKYLDKLPAKQKKGLLFAPDMALGRDGKMRIIETNAGAFQSGLMDPVYQLKDKKTLLGALNAVKNNQALYRHITGRHSQLSAGMRAAGVGGAVAGVGTLAQRLGQKKEEEPSAQYPNTYSYDMYQANS